MDEKLSKIEQKRVAALNAAALVAVGRQGPITPEYVLKMAKEFEKYLQGF